MGKGVEGSEEARVLASPTAASLGGNFINTGIDCTYERQRTCSDEGDDACTGSYCSHFVLSGVRVVSVNTVVLSEAILHDAKKQPLNWYCVERLLARGGAGDTDLWEVSVGQGYYGQEVTGATLESVAASDLDNEIKRLLKLPEKDRVLACLEQEYGYLLEPLKTVTRFEIVKLPYDAVHFPQREYARSLSARVVREYAKWDTAYGKYPLARGVCVEENGVYRLIDGYHRMAAAKGQKHVSVLVGTYA